MEYMATPLKKKPVTKRKPPKKPVQKKEEIEKHLKAINAALGIDESSPEAASIAQAAEQVETKEATEGAHASDLVGGTEPEAEETPEESAPESTESSQAASIEKETEPAIKPEPAAAAVPPPGEGTIPMGGTPTSNVPSATPAPASMGMSTPVPADTSGMPPMTDQTQTAGNSMGADGMVPPADGQPADFGPTDNGEGSKKKKIMLFLLIVLLTVALAAGGVYFYNMMATKQKASQSAAKKQSAAQFKAEATATPTEEPLGNLADYSVQVLNGSGTPGQAGAVENLLGKAGFTDVTTGNADEYSYTDTEVTLKKGAPQALYAAIEKALGAKYVVVQKADELDPESDYDVQVIVGSDTPDTTPTPAGE
jgi:hypothetical protein